MYGGRDDSATVLSVWLCVRDGWRKCFGHFNRGALRLGGGAVCCGLLKQWMVDMAAVIQQHGITIP